MRVAAALCISPDSPISLVIPRSLAWAMPPAACCLPKRAPGAILRPRPPPGDMFEEGRA